MSSEEPIVKNDEIFNTCGEHEDRQVISEFDRTNDTKNVEDNDSYSSDENDEYTEPTCNDSTLDYYEDVGVWYNSVEAIVVDEPNQNDTIDKLIGVRETSMSRQWKILGFEDYLI